MDMYLILVTLISLLNACGEKPVSHIDGITYQQNITPSHFRSLKIESYKDKEDPDTNCVVASVRQIDGSISRALLNPQNGLTNQQLKSALKAFPDDFTRYLNTSVYNIYMVFVPYYTVGTLLRPDIFREDTQTALMMDLVPVPFLAEKLIRNKRFKYIQSRKQSLHVQKHQMFRFINSIMQSKGNKNTCLPN